MTTRIPVTIEGNLTGDPEYGASESGNEYARFSVAVNDRRLNETTGRWEDAGTVFHRVVVFNQQSRNVANSSFSSRSSHGTKTEAVWLSHW